MRTAGGRVESAWGGRAGTTLELDALEGGWQEAPGGARDPGEEGNGPSDDRGHRPGAAGGGGGGAAATHARHAPSADGSRETRDEWRWGVGGAWAEVKTLALGEVARKKSGDMCTQHLSSFSRLSDATRFVHAALVKTHRRGLEEATDVCAVQDGAEWLQGLVDSHRADAVRMLDVPHAAEDIHEIGEAVRTAGGRLPAGWLTAVVHRRTHEGPERVLKHLAWLAARSPGPGLQENRRSFQKREAQMPSPTSHEAGRPSGSGSVESANTLVVEARLQGAGMRWQPLNVNPMLVLRNAVCHGRWNQTWASSRVQRQGQRLHQRQAESQQRLTQAWWLLASWAMRLTCFSAPSVVTASGTTAQPLHKQPPARGGSGSSWRQPFLRRPPSSTCRAKEVSAKK